VTLIESFQTLLKSCYRDFDTDHRLNVSNNMKFPVVLTSVLFA